MKFHLSSYTPKQWAALATIVGAMAATGFAAVALIAGATEMVAVAIVLLVWSFLTGVFFGSGLLYRKLSQLKHSTEESLRQSMAWINLRPLLGTLPVPVGGWAIDAIFGQEVAQSLLQVRPQLVVECGSGTSTVLIGQCLKELGQGRLVSLEHDPDYAQQTREQLKQRGLDHLTEVIYAPLVELTVNGREYRWYDFDPASLAGSIDLLVIDGPPGMDSPLVRYPAIPVLADHLSEGCVILLDDGNRPDEREAVMRWAEAYSGSIDYIEGGKGAWRIVIF